MKRTYIIIILVAVILAAWLFVIVRIDGSITLQGIIMAAIMSVTTFCILAAIIEVIRRVRNNQPLIEERPPQPRKLPLWYRILSKIFG